MEIGQIKWFFDWVPAEEAEREMQRKGREEELQNKYLSNERHRNDKQHVQQQFEQI